MITVVNTALFTDIDIARACIDTAAVFRRMIIAYLTAVDVNVICCVDNADTSAERGGFSDRKSVV